MQKNSHSSAVEYLCNSAYNTCTRMFSCKIVPTVCTVGTMTRTAGILIHGWLKALVLLIWAGHPADFGCMLA